MVNGSLYDKWNVDFSSPSPNPLLSKWVAQAEIKQGYPSKSG